MKPIENTKSGTQEPSFIGRKVRQFTALIKIIWLSFWLAFATTLVFPPIMLSTIFPSKGFFVFQLSRLWAWIVLSATGATVSIKGKEKIDQNQTYIIISNHQSHLDGPALALSLGIQFRWIAKIELLRIPVFGHCLYACGNIFIDRSNPERALESIQNGIDSLPEGVGVMFFAEGTRSTNGRLNQFKKGGFRAAIQTGLPILPVTINGSSKALAKGKLVFKPHPIEVVVGDPIQVDNYSVDKIDELLDHTREVIKSSLHLDQ